VSVPLKPTDPQRFTVSMAAFCFCLTIALCLAQARPFIRDVAKGGLINPDSYMRFVRLDTELQQNATLHMVANDSSGLGTLLHWSHLIDSILVLFATPLMPLLGDHDALRWAGIIFGLVSAGLLGVALAWAAAPITDPKWRWTAPLVAILTASVIGYALPGVVHHHIPIAAAAVMCAAWAARGGTLGARAGIQLGAWAGFGVWLSPETMPFAVMAFGAVAVLWLTQPENRAWGRACAAAGTSLAVVLGLALAVDPPVDGYFSTELDRVSLAWLTLGLLCAAGGWSLWALDRLTIKRRTRALWGCGLAVGLSGFWLALFPAVLRGTDGILNGNDPHAFDGINEMNALSSPADDVQFLVLGVFAVAVTTLLAIRRRSPGWAYAAFCAALLVLESILHRRFATYAACAGAALLPVAITMVNQRFDLRAPIVASASRIALILGLALVPNLVYRAIASPVDLAEPGHCDLQEAVPMMAPFAGQVVLSDVNDVPEILYRTRLLTVGSLYPHARAGFLALRAAWRTIGDPSPNEPVPPEVIETRASLILFCRNAIRSGIVGDEPKTTLWDRMMHNQPPAWAKKVNEDGPSGYTLYRIVQ
jgi:hypothetical protein